LAWPASSPDMSPVELQFFPSKLIISNVIIHQQLRVSNVKHPREMRTCKSGNLRKHA
ncbi:hypothetical protein M9458_010882, partial [Cirrhinus mrigala]